MQKTEHLQGSWCLSVGKGPKEMNSKRDEGGWRTGKVWVEQKEKSESRNCGK